MGKKQLLKSLLVAAALCVGANAWAQTETVTVLSEDYESYEVGDITSTMQSKGWTFQSRNGKNEITIKQGAEDAVNSTKYFDFYYPDGGASRNQSWNFGVANSLNEDNWTLTFLAALNPGTNNSPNKFYIVGTSTGKVTSPNDELTNPMFSLIAKGQASVEYTPNLGGTSYDNITLTSGEWYKFTVKATSIDATAKTAAIAVTITDYTGSTTVFSQSIENMSTASFGQLQGICWNSPRGYSRLNLDDVLLTKEVDASVCAEPTYKVTGAAGTARKFTLACETNNSVIYYATSELAKGATGWTEYTNEETTEAETIYAYAAKGAVTSEVISFATGAGQAITLNAPSLFTEGLVADGSYFNLIVNASYNKSGVQFEPEATLKATFTPNGGTASEVALPYTVTENGTITVTAIADGYSSTEVSMAVYAQYAQSWQSLDFSTIADDPDEVVAALGEGWGKIDATGRWASWTADNEPYSYYQYTEEGVSVPNVTVCEKLRMRNVVLLNVGYGLGRNVTGGEAINVYYTKAGEVVAFKMYNGYGNGTPEEKNFTTYALSNGSTNPSVSTTNGALLIQATIYSPVVTEVVASISDYGYATFASAYPLDLDGIEAYYASAVNENSVTLKKAEGTVKAGTGLVLAGSGEVVIPVAESGDAIEGNLLVGCTKSTDLPANSADCYVLSYNGDNVAEFQSLAEWAEPVNIPAGHAYLKVAEPAEGRLAIVFDNTTTGISNVNAMQQQGEAYNLQGQRVEKAVKGLYIVNGKKVLK